MRSFSEQAWDVCGKTCTAAAFLVILAILAGCQHLEPKVITPVQVQRVEVPRSLLTCSSEPVYGRMVVSMKDLMKFSDQLARAGADCRSKLDAVRRIMEAQ